MVRKTDVQQVFGAGGVSASSPRTRPAEFGLGNYWRWGGALLVLFLALLVPVRSHAQSISVSNSAGQTIGPSSPAFIDPNNASEWPMPYVEVDISGLTCGDSVSVYITMTWADPATGFVTSWESPSATLTAGTSGLATVIFEGESGWALATYEHSGDESEGGEATVLWSVNGTGEPDYNFPIQGDEDPSSSKTMVDNFYNNNQFYNNGGTLVSVPWFWKYILDEESSGRQYATVPGNPLVKPNPDGIGIAQIDGTQNAVDDIDYWNFEANIEDAIIYLTADLDTGPDPPSVFWPSQLSQATSSNPPPNSGPPNGGTALANCEFGPNPGGEVHSWEDAEWITSYKGTNAVSGLYKAGYYIYWSETDNAWEFNILADPSQGYGSYVGNVCNTAGY